MNELIDDVWSERVVRMAVGIAAVDGARRAAGRAALHVEAAFEDVPAPHVVPPPGPMGQDPGIGLPRLSANPSGRFALLHPLPKVPPPGPPQPITIRLFDAAHRFVPRRVRIGFATNAQVAAEDAASRVPPYPRVAPRGRFVALFPGRRYLLGGATAIRSSVVDAAGAPVPWARVTAHNPDDGGVEGVAHADHLGEFVLVLRSTEALIAELPSLDRTVELRVAVPPPFTASPADPALDPLAHLPIEVLPAPGAPDDVSPGVVAPPGYAPVATAVPVTCRLGRVTPVRPFVIP